MITKSHHGSNMFSTSLGSIFNTASLGLGGTKIIPPLGAVRPDAPALSNNGVTLGIKSFYLVC